MKEFFESISNLPKEVVSESGMLLVFGIAYVLHQGYRKIFPKKES